MEGVKKKKKQTRRVEEMCIHGTAYYELVGTASETGWNTSGKSNAG